MFMIFFKFLSTVFRYLRALPMGNVSKIRKINMMVICLLSNQSDIFDSRLSKKKFFGGILYLNELIMNWQANLG